MLWAKLLVEAVPYRDGQEKRLVPGGPGRASQAKAPLPFLDSVLLSL